MPSGTTGDVLSRDDAADILSAELAQIGFESFEVTENGMRAYIPSRLFDPDILHQTLLDSFTATKALVEIKETREIEGEDWNKEWEKNFFRPYILGENKCVVHSSFHTDYPKCEYDIVIDPKMAFGTGHHSTTRLMMNALFQSNIKGKSLIDVGTGSAILAILASKLKASVIDAVEIDEAAYLNAIENIKLNNCDNINVILGVITDTDPDKKYDFLLANINRNIITGDLPEYVKRLKPTGSIFLSGFYCHDIDIIDKVAQNLNLQLFHKAVDNDWAALGYKFKD